MVCSGRDGRQHISDRHYVSTLSWSYLLLVDEVILTQISFVQPRMVHSYTPIKIKQLNSNSDCKILNLTLQKDEGLAQHVDFST